MLVDDAPAVVTVLRAKRTLALSSLLTVTVVSSALLSASTRSVSFFACSLVQIMVSVPC